MGYLFTYVAILGLYLLHLPSLSYALQPDLHVSCPSFSFPLLPLSAFLSVSLTFLSSFPSRAAGSWPMWKPGTAGRETEAVRSPGARTAPWSRASRARLAPAPSEAAHRAGAKGSRRHCRSSFSLRYLGSQRNNRKHFIPGAFGTSRQLGRPEGPLSSVASGRADRPSPALSPPAGLLPGRRRFWADGGPSASLLGS